MAEAQQRLAALRAQMQAHGVAYYWVPSNDAYFSEYVPACWQRRCYLTGFTGSHGAALVGLEDAYLWTDSRYFLQANNQLDLEHFTLMRQGIDSTVLEFLSEQAKEQLVGVDPRLMSMDDINQWQRQARQHNFTIGLLDKNLVDAVWTAVPELPQAAIRQYSEEYAGKSAGDKVDELREKLAAHNADYLLVTTLDALAWLTNLRGSDVDYNPLFIGFAVVAMESVVLFVDQAKVTAELSQYLESQGIRLADSDKLQSYLKGLQGSVWCDPQCTNQWTKAQLEANKLLLLPSPIHLMKAVKNPTEQAGIIEAHRRDAVAMVRFLVWLQSNWQGLTECTLADRLEQFRAEDPDFQGLSFPTIAGYRDHGAIIHYKAVVETAHEISDQGVLLLDSGAQYLQGTTDITRTMHLGEPTEGERHHYTLVLKGHIALSQAVFPHGTCGENLDVLARCALWQERLDYGHGTGHGVGCYLCVHEGPQRISPIASKVPLLPGMVVSNEPGVYFAGQYGIRVENLVMVESLADKDQSATGHGPFYGFKDLTLVPHAKNLIDSELLSTSEIEFINDYHKRVYDVLAEDLKPVEKAWLQKACSAL